MRRSTRAWKILIPGIPKPKSGPASSLLLVAGFLGLIVIGSLLLMLPVASNNHEATPVVDVVFTATSAVCVTGLVTVDTADHWSPFGQAVILFLIQAGGFGFMTGTTLFLLAFGRRITLRERLLISESMGLDRLGGLTAIVWQMALFTFVIEAAGAAIFYVHFSASMSAGNAAWNAVFQSVSAFNNAGFDIFGGFRSMTGQAGSPLLLLTTATLIILGGISFLVVSDIIRKRHWLRLAVDTKLILVMTGVLLTVGTVIILLSEYNNPATLGLLTTPEKFMNAFFQSVTSRTAGFSAIETAGLHDYALFFTMLLMFIGGASGSTAGGIKVNTFGVLLSTTWSAIRGREHVHIFSREFIAPQIHRALAVIFISLIIIALSVFLLTLSEEQPFLSLLFESFSAFGTVGLSTGITPALTTAGKIIITLTMYIGRLGPLALVLALVQRQRTASFRYPVESIRIG